MAAKQRDYAAIYARRVARGKELGLSRAQSVGHARATKGERSITQIKQLSGRTGLSQAAVTRWAKEKPAGPRGGMSMFSVAAGVGFDTNSDRDAAQYVRAAARQEMTFGRIIGTRQNKRGVVLHEISAADFLEEVEFQGGVAAAIEKLAPARYMPDAYGPGSPIVRFHFFAVDA